MYFLSADLKLNKAKEFNLLLPAHILETNIAALTKTHGPVVGNVIDLREEPLVAKV